MTRIFVRITSYFFIMETQNSKVSAGVNSNIFQFNERGLFTPEMVEKEFEGGYKATGLLVGETGRNRREGMVFCSANEMNCNVKPIPTRTGKSFRLKEEPNFFGVICLITPNYGFRGGSKITFSRPEYTEVLAEGQVADGTAGRMADSKHLIVSITENQLVVIKRSGRLYRAEAETYFWINVDECSVSQLPSNKDIWGDTEFNEYAYLFPEEIGIESHTVESHTIEA